MPGREIFSKSETDLTLILTTLFDGVLNSDVVDLQNVNAVLFVVFAGVIFDGTHAITFEESDDVGFSSPVAVPESDLRGATFADLIFTGSVMIVPVSVVNNKRFLRGVVTTTGATSGGEISIFAVKQMLTLAPAS